MILVVFSSLSLLSVQIPFISFESSSFDLLKQDETDITINGELFLQRNFIHSGDVVFDVGAGIGEWSSYALKAASNIHLFSFEPYPNAYQKLAANLANSSARLSNIALSNAKGKGILHWHEAEHWGQNSLFFRSVNHNLFRGQIEVETDTLDNFCKLNNVEKIDFLKIDTEGSELNILKGARELLNKHKIRGIQFEYGGTYLDANTTLREMAELLTNAGYCIFRIQPHSLVHFSSWSPALESYLYMNFFAILQSEAGCDLMKFDGNGSQF